MGVVREMSTEEMIVHLKARGYYVVCKSDVIKLSWSCTRDTIAVNQRRAETVLAHDEYFKEEALARLRAQLSEDHINWYAHTIASGTEVEIKVDQATLRIIK